MINNNRFNNDKEISITCEMAREELNEILLSIQQAPTERKFMELELETKEYRDFLLQVIKDLS